MGHPKFHGGQRLGSDAEKSWGGLTLRTCHTVGEFRQAVALQKDIWGFDDLDLVPSRIFVVAEKIGGHVLGAYDGRSLVAFAFALPGIRDGHPYIHSHMLGVKEAHRNTGLGREMKLFQRELAISQGYELIEWTFDPLEIKNAFFNIEKLGAVALRGESIWDHLVSATGRASQRSPGSRVVAVFRARRGDAGTRKAPASGGRGAGRDSGRDPRMEGTG